MSLTYVVECSTTEEEAIGVARIKAFYDSYGKPTDYYHAVTFAACLPDGMWVSAFVHDATIHALQ